MPKIEAGRINNNLGYCCEYSVTVGACQTDGLTIEAGRLKILDLTLTSVGDTCPSFVFYSTREMLMSMTCTTAI